MWWVIGICAAALLVLLFVKVRAATRQIQLADAGVKHLRFSFVPLSGFDPNIDKRVWGDPYLLGYAQGSLLIMTEAFGKKLSEMQRNLVKVRVIETLVGPNYGEVCERIGRLSLEKDAEFGRGFVHGANVVTLMANRPGPEVLADTDVQAALRESPETMELHEYLFGATDVSPFGTAGGVLMNTYMSRHRELAGYGDRISPGVS